MVLDSFFVNQNIQMETQKNVGVQNMIVSLLHICTVQTNGFYKNGRWDFY